MSLPSRSRSPRRRTWPASAATTAATVWPLRRASGCALVDVIGRPFDFAQRQLARQHDAGDAEPGGEAGAFGAGDGHLGRGVDGELRADGGGEQGDGRVLDQDGVDARRGDGAQDGLDGRDLGLEEQGVDGDVELDVGAVGAGGQVGEREVGGAGAGVEAVVEAEASSSGGGGEVGTSGIVPPIGAGGGGVRPCRPALVPSAKLRLRLQPVSRLLERSARETTEGKVPIPNSTAEISHSTARTSRAGDLTAPGRKRLNLFGTPAIPLRAPSLTSRRWRRTRNRWRTAVAAARLAPARRISCCSCCRSSGSPNRH